MGSLSLSQQARPSKSDASVLQNDRLRHTEEEHRLRIELCGWSPLTNDHDLVSEQMTTLLGFQHSCDVDDVLGPGLIL